ncbi:MAG: NADPH:quinone reductase [Actinomycetota bacterium]|nr:NADPH:quinone reductase [Actinomycetota bacterium]
MSGPSGTTMRAWQVNGSGEPVDVLHMVDLAVPDPGPGQIRVRVTAAGIGLPDVLMCRGTYPLTPPLPFTPGQEATGVITAVGDGVEREIGSRVMFVSAFYDGHGSFAEECLALSSTAFPVPAGLTDAEAAGFWIPHLTAWIGLVERGRLDPGEWLAVLGAAGGSGIAAVQLGRALGGRVVAVVGDDERAQFCLQLGAEIAIDHRHGPLAPALRATTEGHGVDVIYDPVGGAMAEDAAGSLARNGRHLLVGFAGGRWPAIAAHDLVVANASLVGVFAGGQSPAELGETHRALSRLIDDGSLRNAITGMPTFDELPSALQRLADRRVIGKLVMVP